MEKLLKALEKEKNRLRIAPIIVDGKQHDIHYNIMSGEDHERALQLSKKTKTVKETDGSTTELTYYDDDLLRAHIIYFQLKDKEGDRVFKDITKVKWIKDNIAYETMCYLASVMGLKSVSDIVEEQQEVLKKTSG